MRPLAQRLAATFLAPLLQRMHQILRHLWRELDRGQLNLHAMSLSFTTLLSLAPLLAVSFSVLKAFGVQGVLQPFLLNLLEPLGTQGEEIVGRIVSFVENIRVGVLGAIGLGLLFYTVVALMQKVERAFNDVWRVREDRPLAQRFTHYLSVVIVGPVLLFALVNTLTELTVSASGIDMPGGGALAWLLHQLEGIAPFLMLTGAFAFIYSYVPNTQVKPAPALIGALLAAVVWLFTGRIFAEVVVKASSYTAIYSAFASLMLFMLWLHLAWLILLLGASLSYALQHPERLDETDVEVHRPDGESAIRIAALIAHDFARAGPGWSVPAMSQALHLAHETVQSVVNRMESAGFLVRDTGQPPRWRPAAALNSIPLSRIYTAVEPELETSHDRPPVQRLLSKLDQARQHCLEGMTLRDLADIPPASTYSDNSDEDQGRAH